jgi:hypothetical protein
MKRDYLLSLPVALQPNSGLGRLFLEVSISHTHTLKHTHSRYDSSERVISSSQRPLLDNNQHSQETDIHAPAGFEPAIPANEEPQTHVMDRAASGTGEYLITLLCLCWLQEVWTTKTKYLNRGDPDLYH